MIVTLAQSSADCIGIDADLTGVTVLAVGSSLPDMFSSIIVAKEGKGSMAVSNALGSNIFDILVCLGVPFSLKSAANNFLSTQVESDSLATESFVTFVATGAVTLLLLLGMMAASYGLRGGVRTMQLYRWQGILLIAAYAAFVLGYTCFDIEEEEVAEAAADALPLTTAAAETTTTLGAMMMATTAASMTTDVSLADPSMVHNRTDLI